MCAAFTTLLLLALLVAGVLRGTLQGYIMAAVCAGVLVLAALSNHNPGETGRDPGHTGA